VAHMGQEEKVFKGLVGKSKGRRPLGRLRHRLEDGTKVDLRQTWWGRVD
jgi:hypothetical protein